ncbi:hypothetical protein GCM10011584_11150 [Nocardioides phosphati]|uniref:Uncharacterized protein n=1 Tax=Nocardioides phosphati TaxID=1867775 RepID=A0ABQ2N9F1_9ACTN|nr:ribonuclease domain-containing protein [Nocardioides phosphati]GGO87174.1 hypothetical protein GCM10011584_11150 [Nocardioides phosphati]
MSLPRTRSPLFAALLVALVLGALWLLDGRTVAPTGDDRADRPSAARTQPSAAHRTEPSAPVRTTSPDASRGSAASAASGTDPVSGLRWVRVDQLPPEAEETLELIDHDGPYPYDRDGVTFGNYEGLLPQHARGYYHEYTVPTPGEGDRGARRIITGDDDEFFYTGDHYSSFERIAR